jgi:D-alanyl-D-alanine carboxypeptidase
LALDTDTSVGTSTGAGTGADAEVRPEALNEPSAQAEVQPEEHDGARLSEGEAWELRLVNAKNPLPENYMPQLAPLSNGLEFDERAVDKLNAMLSAMQDQGLSPVVCSAYRSIDYQRMLFDNEVSQGMALGLSKEQAAAEVSTFIAYPGTSEHNLGLAAGIVSLNYQLLDDNQAHTAEAKWLRAHCAEYGFILRYPQGKESVTGIIYEPWHFRYVGTPAAQHIMQRAICLEEYLECR